MNTEEQNIVEQTGTQNNAMALDEIIAKYSALDRKGLVKELSRLLKEDNFENLRTCVPLLKNAFLSLPEIVKETKVEREEGKQNTEQSDSEQVIVKKEDNGQELDRTLADDPVKKEFFELYDVYKQKRQQYVEQQEIVKQKNLEKKHSLLEELRILLDSEKTLKEIYDEFNNIQDKWKEVGNVPHAEVNSLWESYRFLIDKFYEKVKINRELRDLDLKKNLEDKLALCEKAEELLLSEDVNMSFQILQEYHREWKQIGAVPTDKREEVWERFKKASENINARRKEYYEKRSDELDANLKQKQELVEQAIEINSHQRQKLSEWNEDTDSMNKLIDKWKTIGPVPHSCNEEIWNKFKVQKDGFFEAKKEVFAHNKQMEEDNYNKKISICEMAEAIAKRTDFDIATREILELQKQWKTIGFVRKSLSDKIWLRFRAACDEFFKQKSENYLRTHKEVEENIQKRISLIDELKSYNFTDDKVQNVTVLKEFQKRWFDIGFTPKRERSELQQKWDEIITENKEKLQITATEIAQRGAKFLENVAQMGQNSKKIINNRILNLEKQIDSLENNIGFLSGSKNADILKQEFEKKIDRLKEEKTNLMQALKECMEEKIENEK